MEETNYQSLFYDEIIILFLEFDVTPCVEYANGVSSHVNDAVLLVFHLFSSIEKKLSQMEWNLVGCNISDLTSIHHIFDKPFVLDLSVTIMLTSFCNGVLVQFIGSVISFIFSFSVRSKSFSAENSQLDMKL